jgi:hypothetical protein
MRPDAVSRLGGDLEKRWRSPPGRLSTASKT